MPCYFCCVYSPCLWRATQDYLRIGIAFPAPFASNFFGCEDGRIGCNEEGRNKADQQECRSTKKIFAQGEIKWKKIHVRQLTLKNIHATVYKKIHTRNLITKKKKTAQKFPTPPITFLMVRPLIHRINVTYILRFKMSHFFFMPFYRTC